MFDHAGIDVFVDLERLKQWLKIQVDTSAETERMKYITPGHGQMMTYQQKVAEAQAFKATAIQSLPTIQFYPRKSVLPQTRLMRLSMLSLQPSLNDSKSEL